MSHLSILFRLKSKSDLDVVSLFVADLLLCLGIVVPLFDAVPLEMHLSGRWPHICIQMCDSVTTAWLGPAVAKQVQIIFPPLPCLKVATRCLRWYAVFWFSPNVLPCIWNEHLHFWSCLFKRNRFLQVLWLAQMKLCKREKIRSHNFQ